MSLARMLRRDVTLIPRRVGGIERGREVIVDGTPIVGLRAARDLKAGEEDRERRDLQVRTFRYLLEARHPETGEDLEISGWDWIVDAGETFEIVGPIDPAEQRNRGRIHHLEFDARRFDSTPPEVGS